MNIDEIADELYGLDPDEFTGARDAVAKQATDPGLRKAVKALRKPTAAAHAVNRLVRDRPDDIDRLLDLGDELRASMGRDAEAVRRLSEERRSAIGSLVERGLPTAVQQDVTATLEAATADPDLGAAVRSGRLVKPLRYAGFGAGIDLSDVVATPLRKQSAGKPAKRATKPTKRAEKTAAEPPVDVKEPGPDLADARQRVLDLAGAADDAQRRYEQAVRAATEARHLLDLAETERADAKKAARAAHAAAEKARRELGKLERS